MKIHSSATVTFPETEEARAITFYKTADNQNVIINSKYTFKTYGDEDHYGELISFLGLCRENVSFTTKSKIYKILSLLRDGKYYTRREIQEKLNLNPMTLSLTLNTLTSNNFIFKTAPQEKLFFKTDFYSGRGSYTATRVKYVINDEALKILQEVEE